MGAFYAHYIHFLSPDSAFDGFWSVMPIVGSLFGGIGTLIGPSIGAFVITGLDEFVFKRFFETGHKLFFGLLLAVVIVWAPVGLLGKWVKKNEGVEGNKYDPSSYHRTFRASDFPASPGSEGISGEGCCDHSPRQVGRNILISGWRKILQSLLLLWQV